MKIIKFFVIGEREVGKSALIDTYLWKLHFGYAYHDHLLDARRYHIQLVEISQLEELKNKILKNIYDVAIFLVCFKVDDRKTLKAARNKWLPAIRRINESANICLTALQCDLRSHLKQKILRKCVRRSEGLQLCRFCENLHYLECSNLKVNSVKEAFENTLKIVLYGKEEPEMHIANSIFKRIRIKFKFDNYRNKDTIKL